MIDRDQLREANEKAIRYGVLDADSIIMRASKLVADPDTLVISKVDGEWPEWAIDVSPGEEQWTLELLDVFLKGGNPMNARQEAIEAMAQWMAEKNDEWADDELMWGEYLPDAENALDAFLKWFAEHPAVLDALLEQSNQ